MILVLDERDQEDDDEYVVVEELHEDEIEVVNDCTCIVCDQ
jgi:hypothetical protein